MTKILKILTNPNKTLRKKSINIDPNELNTEEFKELCSDMAETMKKKDGVGLAAPQIGKNIRVFVLGTKDGIKFFINPEIIKKSWIKETGEEGCLSVPDVFGLVKRHKKIKVKFLNRSGETEIIEATGLMARVIQHENDHLDGILFIDKAKNIKKL